ncbi:hypothetical protein [Lactiplantibacillus carotarum]|uniref:hypothetical protein n=1 Tax=Lactiplantibacillus carotarum TaxID=2993456 RepID=UPI00298F3D95|nr:hypothetical protein [Lactiplantibacillus carotarum]
MPEQEPTRMSRLKARQDATSKKRGRKPASGGPQGPQDPKKPQLPKSPKKKRHVSLWLLALIVVALGARSFTSSKHLPTKT